MLVLVQVGLAETSSADLLLVGSALEEEVSSQPFAQKFAGAKGGESGG